MPRRKKKAFESSIKHENQKCTWDVHLLLSVPPLGVELDVPPVGKIMIFGRPSLHCAFTLFSVIFTHSKSSSKATAASTLFHEPWYPSFQWCDFSSESPMQSNKLFCNVSPFMLKIEARVLYACCKERTAGFFTCGLSSLSALLSLFLIPGYFFSL